MQPDIDGAFARQVASLENCDFSVHVDAALSHPAFSLGDLIERHQASLVVLAPDATEACGGWLVRRGGTRAVSGMEAPVLLGSSRALQDESGRSCTRLLHHVLYAADLGPAPDGVFDFVLGLASLGVRTFTLLHVRRPGAPGGARPDTREAERLDAMKRMLLSKGVEVVHSLIETGAAADVIGARVSGSEHSLVVIGAPGQRVDADHVGDHISEIVVRQARCPVLLVPPLGQRVSA